MPRIRKPRNLSLDPALSEALERWCKSQITPPPFARAVDTAIAVFLETQGVIVKPANDADNAD
ncbi:MAG: hypothetical protein AAF700_14970 [Pseudomonadota bacterium]